MIAGFEAYVWSFYGPGEICGEFFDGTLTIPEVKAACQLRYLDAGYEGDSVDREMVRDILLAARRKDLSKHREG